MHGIYIVTIFEISIYIILSPHMLVDIKLP